jgi:hypothetical protein
MTQDEREHYAMSRLRQDAEPEWYKRFGMTADEAAAYVKTLERFDTVESDEPIEHYINPCDALEAENERLREALMQVLERAVLEEGSTWKDTANEMGMIAHDALMHAKEVVG